ncbi:MAG: hypothetical protein ACREJR_01500 [Candidatus Rokuibacteriota bacterium]
MLSAIVDTEHGSLPFFTTQLNSDPSQSATRCTQVAASAHLVAHAPASDLPVVVTGE